MSNSKWQVHKVGLINFWYYDEEEFHFLDGRMLLRGANGSGKSVTMQSFIPLLLDGNMRPERLDPFGSRARKMENYLLEEDDEREERTGYLYMELKRMEAEKYVSIGIGMRGRKNKKLDCWYFCITDGRRIGKDIQLYKDVESKIPYTKIELRNRIGDGGRVMDTQGEYMECVNRLLFGFETMEEYKEMLELLIQLRTPKLSKDFKPSVINDILSNSLQTLSEDDLRPMSEAIENMDNLKTNLETLRDSIKAAGSVQKVYDQYYRRVLFEKAVSFQTAKKELDESQKTEQDIIKTLAEKQEEMDGQEKRYQDLLDEIQVLQTEEKSLRKHDSWHLKEDENLHLEKISDLQRQLTEKKKQEEKKRETENEELQNKKKQQEKNEACWDGVTEHLDEMQNLMEDIPFDASAFFIKDVREQQEISFDAHSGEWKNYRDKVESGIKILREEKQKESSYNETLKELDQKKEERNLAEKELSQYEKLLHDTKEEFIEQVYKWEKENTQLHLSPSALQEIAVKIDRYQFGADYSEVNEIIRKEKNPIEDSIRNDSRVLQEDWKEQKSEREKLQQELEEWVNQKEPEPECSPAVQANREKLKELQIPYYEFYKTVDFSNTLSTEQAGHIEEALLHMGVLDALIIPESYRSQVLNLDEGLCDKYIFSDVKFVQKNLTEYLDVDNEKNDIVFYQEIAKILSSIGICGSQESGFPAWIDASGNYKLGILEGTVTKQYQPKFIGTAARERYKQEKIQELQAQITEADLEIQRLQEQIEILQKRANTLEEEQKNFPKEEDLKIAAKDFADRERTLENVRVQIEQCEKTLESRRKELEDVRFRVQEICAKTYLTIRLDVFEEAADSLKEYGEEFQEVRNYYNRYQSGLELLRKCEENLDTIEEDLDNLRYDISHLSGEKNREEAQLLSIRQQLEMSDYQQIQERLDYCQNRLNRIPQERDETVTKKSELKKDINQLLDDRNKCKDILEQKEKLLCELQEVFHQEYLSGDVALGDTESKEDAEIANQAVKILEGQIDTGNIEDIAGKLQEVFHANKAYLADYHLTMQNLFEELRENVTLASRKVKITRLDIRAKYRGSSVRFPELLEKLQADAAEQEKILSDKDRELFEDILANTIAKKIRARIHASKRWVDAMNELMESMQTSSGLRLSLRWKSKKAEKEEQMDTKALVDLLQKDVEIMRMDEVEKMSAHFRSKIQEARKQTEDSGNIQSFHMIMREILDYRKWFEFQLECQKTGEKKKELTDRVFFTFSGGEKAMAMYVPLFSAVVAKYSGAGKDAPRLISLDEAFAGVDETNIKDMFRLMVEFEFNFMINSQILWGDYETVPSIAIYQLIRPENAKYVSVIAYVWNGKTRVMTDRIGD